MGGGIWGSKAVLSPPVRPEGRSAQARAARAFGKHPVRVALRAGWVVTHPSWDVLMLARAGHIGGLGGWGCLGSKAVWSPPSSF